MRPTQIWGEGADRRRRLVGWSALGIVAIPLAIRAFEQGVEDWQYQLAGLADPFLGRPAPAWTAAIAGVVGVVIGGVAWIVRRALAALPGSREPTPVPDRWRPRWWAPLAVGCLAWLLGAVVVVAGGGPRSYAGTLRMAVGAPVDATVEVPATCRTPVGKPDHLAELIPNADGMLGLSVLHPATGRPDLWTPAPPPARADVVGSRMAADAYPLPNVPRRPLPYLSVTGNDGMTTDAAPIGFLATYTYGVRTLEGGTLEGGDMAGRAEIIGHRRQDPYVADGARWVNLHVPDDPWPDTLTIRLTWACSP